MVNIPDGFAQVNWIFTGSACPTGAQTTLGLNVQLTDDNPTELAEQMYIRWELHFHPIQTTTTVLSQVLVKYGPTDVGPSGQFGGSANGNIASSGIQPATSLLVQKVTEFGGRAGRGRFFMPGLSESDVSESGILGGAYLGAAQSAWDAFGVSLATLVLDPVVLHGEDSPLSAPSSIIAFSVQSKVATQRRRLRR